MSQKVLLNAKAINIILHRLACQLIEKHNDFTNTVLIGLQPRGVFLADRLAKILQQDYNIKNIQSVGPGSAYAGIEKTNWRRIQSIMGWSG